MARNGTEIVRRGIAEGLQFMVSGRRFLECAAALLLDCALFCHIADHNAEAE